jgi:hypothetical protein
VATISIPFLYSPIAAVLPAGCHLQFVETEDFLSFSGKGALLYYRGLGALARGLCTISRNYSPPAAFNLTVTVTSGIPDWFG